MMPTVMLASTWPATRCDHQRGRKAAARYASATTITSRRTARRKRRSHCRPLPSSHAWARWIHAGRSTPRLCHRPCTVCPSTTGERVTDFGKTIAEAYAASGGTIELGQAVHDGGLVHEAEVKVALKMAS